MALILAFGLTSLSVAFGQSGNQSTSGTTQSTTTQSTKRHHRQKTAIRNRSTPHPTQNGTSDRQLSDTNLAPNSNQVPTPPPNDQVNPGSNPVKPRDPTNPTVVTPR
jgi:hypothetical protein